MTRTIKVLLSGGFHDAAEITVRAKIETKTGYVEHYNTIDGQTAVTVSRPQFMAAQLSHSQIRRIQRHFCGCCDCECGGAARADIDLPDGWIINDSLNDPDATHFVRDEATQ